MRDVRFLIFMFIIAIGFAFQPGTAWGYTLGDPIVVKPYIPQKDGAVPTTEFHVYCYNPFTGVTEDCEHELQLREREQSGDDPAGHEHDGVRLRPIGKLTGGENGCDLGCENLKFKSYKFMLPVYLDYLAPEVSGDYVVDWSYKKWWMTSPVLEPSAFWFNVKVPLSPMPADYPHYRLTGQTTEHPDNHYGTDALVERLTLISDDYYEYTGDLGTAFTLGINDMSLPMGGMFDLNRQWWVENTSGNGHVAHRDGKSVDIDHYDQFGNWTIKENFMDKRMVQKYNCKRLEQDKGLIHYECK